MEAHFEKDYYQDLLSWEELEWLINIRPLMTSERVKIIEQDEDEVFEWENPIWATDHNCWTPSLIKKIIDSRVLYINDMSKSTRKINEFSGLLEDIYDCQCDAHIYIAAHKNIKKNHPFGIHFDYADNVIVQCEGTTNFKVWDEVDASHYSTNVNLHNATAATPILNVNMKPGDAIWIPKHYPHLATSKTKRLSVSFPMASNDFLNPDDGWVREDRSWVKLNH